MITNRSNHMPIVTASATTQMTIGLRRRDLIQNTCGLNTLQMIMVQ